MATRNIVPRADGEGSIGTAAKHWGNGYFDELNTEKLVADDVIAKGPIVDVRAFGAVGDGVHDDTQAIQTAINYAVDNKIPTVFIPGGNYLITGQLSVKEGITLLGTRKGFSQIYETWHPTQSLITESRLKIIPANMQVDNTITMGNNATLEGLEIIYPNQAHYGNDEVVEYPLTIKSSHGCSFVNIAFDGAYNFIEHIGERLYIDRLFGYSLGTAVTLKDGNDVAYINDVHLNLNITRREPLVNNAGNTDNVGIYVENYDGVIITNYHCLMYNTALKVKNINGGYEVVNLDNFFFDQVSSSLDCDINSYQGFTAKNGNIVMGYNYNVNDKIAIKLANSISNTNSKCVLENIKMYSAGGTWYNTGGGTALAIKTDTGIDLSFNNLYMVGFDNNVLPGLYNIVRGWYKNNDKINYVGSRQAVTNYLANGDLSKVCNGAPLGWATNGNYSVQCNKTGTVTVTTLSAGQGVWTGLTQSLDKVGYSGCRVVAKAKNYTARARLFIAYLVNGQEVKNESKEFVDGFAIINGYANDSVNWINVVVYPGEENGDSIEIEYVVMSNGLGNDCLPICITDSAPEINIYSIKGNGAPAIKPQFVGQEYYDLTNRKIYKAIGESAITDWIVLN